MATLQEEVETLKTRRDNYQTQVDEIVTNQATMLKKGSRSTVEVHYLELKKDGIIGMIERLNNKIANMELGL